MSESVANDLGLRHDQAPDEPWHHQCRSGPYKGAWMTLREKTCRHCGRHWTEAEKLPKEFIPIREWKDE